MGCGASATPPPQPMPAAPTVDLAGEEVKALWAQWKAGTNPTWQARLAQQQQAQQQQESKAADALTPMSLWFDVLQKHVLQSVPDSMSRATHSRRDGEDVKVLSRFMRALTAVVDTAVPPAFPRDALLGMARVHTERGVMPHHYHATGAATLAALRECMGSDRVTAAVEQRVRDNWQKVAEQIVAVQYELDPTMKQQHAEHAAKLAAEEAEAAATAAAAAAAATAATEQQQAAGAGTGAGAIVDGKPEAGAGPAEAGAAAVATADPVAAAHTPAAAADASTVAPAPAAPFAVAVYPVAVPAAAPAAAAAAAADPNAFVPVAV